MYLCLLGWRPLRMTTGSTVKSWRSSWLRFSTVMTSSQAWQKNLELSKMNWMFWGLCPCREVHFNRVIEPDEVFFFHLKCRPQGSTKWTVFFRCFLSLRSSIQTSFFSSWWEVERDGHLMISSSCLIEGVLISKISWYFAWLEHKSDYKWLSTLALLDFLHKHKQKETGKQHQQAMWYSNIK